jgi:hypothetical protein
MYTLEYAQSVADDLRRMPANQRSSERLVITQKGKPLALPVGARGLDAEQLDLGSSDKFWRLIARRRTQKTLSRSDLERKLAGR